MGAFQVRCFLGGALPHHLHNTLEVVLLYFPAAIATLCSAALGALGAFLVQRYSNKKSLERDHQNRVWHKKEELYLGMINCMKSIEFYPASGVAGEDGAGVQSYACLIKIVEEFLDAHLASIHLYLDDDAMALKSLNEFFEYLRGVGADPISFDQDIVAGYIRDVVTYARADLGM